MLLFRRKKKLDQISVMNDRLILYCCSKYLLGFLLSWALFYSCSLLPSPKDELLKLGAIPAIVFKLELATQKDSTYLLSMLKDEKLDDSYHRLIDLADEIQQIQTNKSNFFYLLINALGAEHFDLSFVLDGAVNDREIKAVLEKYSSNTLKAYNTGQSRVFELFTGTDSSLYVAQKGHLCILSDRALAVEEAIYQMTKADVPSFQDRTIEGKEGDWIFGKQELWQQLCYKRHIPQDSISSYFFAQVLDDYLTIDYSDPSNFFCNQELNYSAFEMLPVFVPSFSYDCTKEIASSKTLEWIKQPIIWGEAALSGIPFVLLPKEKEKSFNVFLEELINEKGVVAILEHGPYKAHQIAGFELEIGEEFVLKNPYILDLGRYVLMLPDEARLQLWLDYLTINNTFSNQAAFQQQFYEMNHPVYACKYQNSNYLNEWYKVFWRHEAEEKLQAMIHLFYSQEKSIQHAQLPIFGKQTSIPAEINWRVKLPDTIGYGLQVFRQSIFVPTQTSNLYLIDLESGQFKQKLELKEPLISEFEIIDFPNEAPVFVWGQSTNFHYLFDERGNLGVYPALFSSRQSL